jgi:hypothetical protein
MRSAPGTSAKAHAIVRGVNYFCRSQISMSPRKLSLIWSVSRDSTAGEVCSSSNGESLAGTNACCANWTSWRPMRYLQVRAADAKIIDVATASRNSMI